VVPDDDGIAVEAALPNKDAGFVLPGQSVEIKVEAFPFTRYGTVPGEVKLVSSDTMQGPDSDPTQRRQGGTGGGGAAAGSQMSDANGPVYSVRIRPLRGTIHADGRDVALTPGMAVTAEIKTGRRRVISYLLDPVVQHVDESFRER
jgi:hemolysin D